MRTLPIMVLLASLAAPAGVWAAPNDFVLHRFRACGQVRPCNAGIVYDSEFVENAAEPNRVLRVLPDGDGFASFVTELGIALAPRILEPAETLGQAGFAFGVGTAVTDIDEEQSYWSKAMPGDGQAAPGALTTLHLQLRKGLPFSFEIGGTLTHLVDSGMFALGADVKWAINEGFVFLPDIAVRGSVNRLVGNRDLDLIVGGGDVTVSNPFAIGGMVTLTPYAGWGRLIINGSSHVLDATPGLDGFPPPHCNVTTGADERSAGEEVFPEECVRAVESVASADLRANFVLTQQRRYLDRFFAGLRFKFTVISLVAEATFGDSVGTYAAKIDLDF